MVETDSPSRAAGILDHTRRTIDIELTPACNYIPKIDVCAVADFQMIWFFAETQERLRTSWIRLLKVQKASSVHAVSIREMRTGCGQQISCQKWNYTLSQPFFVSIELRERSGPQRFFRCPLMHMKKLWCGRRSHTSYQSIVFFSTSKTYLLNWISLFVILRWRRREITVTAVPVNKIVLQRPVRSCGHPSYYMQIFIPWYVINSNLNKNLGFPTYLKIKNC